MLSNVRKGTLIHELIEKKANDTLCPEGNRILFLIHRDGYDEAIAWSKRTKQIYRKALLNKSHHANKPLFRKSYIESYLALKRFTRGN